MLIQALSYEFINLLAKGDALNWKSANIGLQTN